MSVPFISPLIAYSSTHRIKSVVIVSILLLGAVFVYNKVTSPGAELRYVMTPVTKDTLVSSVTGTGQVGAIDKIDLKPQGSGKLIEVDAHNGQMLHAGQIVAIIDQRSALISIKQASANLESAKANYAKLVAGATDADVAVTKASLQSAATTLSNAKENLIDKIHTSVVTLTSAIFSDTNFFFANSNTDNPHFSVPNFQISNSQVVSDIDSKRQHINQAFPVWKNHTDALNEESDLMSAYSEAAENLLLADSLLGDMSTILNNYTTGDSTKQSTLDGYKSTINSARSTITSANSSILSANQTLNNALSSYSQSEANLKLKTAAARPEDIAASLAGVHTAEASLQNADYQYENNIIRAPFDGQLANLSVNVGDWVSTGAASGSGTSIGSVLTTQKIAQITMNEVDVAKIKLGNKATITFDALPDLTISGSVADIDALGTVTSGVVSYNVKIKLDTQDDRIKPGMSLSAAIITAIKSDVLTVPTGAIKTAGGSSYVLTFSEKLPGGTDSAGVPTKLTPIQKPVVVGTSNDTQTEIVSGLAEGDEVVERTLTGTATKATTAPSLFSAAGVRTGGGTGAVRGAQTR